MSSFVLVEWLKMFEWGRRIYCSITTSFLLGGAIFLSLIVIFSSPGALYGNTNLLGTFDIFSNFHGPLAIGLYVFSQTKETRFLTFHYVFFPYNRHLSVAHGNLK